MPTQRLANIRRGRMTADDKDKIIELAETMKNPKPGVIAARINRHPATVNWFMLTRGLIERKAGHARQAYKRNGKTIYPYSTEQDTRLEQLRVENKPFREIAEILTNEFGFKRTAHSVQVRLVQLTASPDE